MWLRESCKKNKIFLATFFSIRTKISWIPNTGIKLKLLNMINYWGLSFFNLKCSFESPCYGCPWLEVMHSIT
jgi:hypothetical protein